MQFNPLSPADEQRLRDAIKERSPIRAKQALQWVAQLDRVTRDLRASGTETHPDTVAAFWVKLYALLDEIGGEYESVCAHYDRIGASTDRDAIVARIVRDSIRDVKAAMDEDELMWLNYRRDVESHVWQDGYELSRKKNGLKETREFDLIGKRMTHEEFDKRARALLRKHHVNEPAMAVHFAMLVAPHVAQVVAVLRSVEML